LTSYNIIVGKLHTYLKYDIFSTKLESQVVKFNCEYTVAFVPVRVYQII